MAAHHYSLGFTTGPALLRETIDVATLKCELDDWVAVRGHVLEDNTFQSRTVSTLKKLFGEVSLRLKYLNDDELRVLAFGSDIEQKQLVWLAICRRYSLIRDFAIEVLSPNYDAARYGISLADYDAFFNAKSEWHKNLEESSDLTKKKARQVLFKILRECGLINDQNEITGQHMNATVLALLHKGCSEDLSVFPGWDN